MLHDRRFGTVPARDGVEYGQVHPQDATWGAAMQDRVWVEARRLYDSETPPSEAIRRWLEIAGENPNAFHGSHKKAAQGLTVSETQTILRLVATACIERDDSHRVSVRLPSLRRWSGEERRWQRCCWSVASAGIQDPRLLDAEEKVRQLADVHCGDADGGAALREAVDQLLVQVVTVDRLAHKTAETSESILASPIADLVIAEHLGGFAKTDANPFNARAGSWWPPGD